MTRRRAVITGMGLVCPGATSIEEFWGNLSAGRSCTTDLPEDLKGGLPVRAAGIPLPLQFDAADPVFIRRPRGRLPLFVRYALTAAASAVKAADLDVRNAEAEPLGVIIGTGAGGVPHMRAHLDVLRERGWRRVDPQALVQVLPNLAVGHVATAFSARGFNATIVASCASSTQAIGEAMLAIRSGRSDVVLVGGTEAWLTDIGLASFAVLGALSTWEGDPAAASRPFDRHRSGFVPAEGAAMLVMEERSRALARRAPILAEVLGYGNTNDAYHLVAPDPAGVEAAQCISLALNDAGLAATDIDYVNAHGTSTVRGDAAETSAIRMALGRHAEKIPVSATKSMLGHSMGASGAIEAAACVQTLQTGIIHPTANLETPDPECDLDYVPGSPRTARVNHILKNSFGFGGHNVSLVISRPDAG